MPAVSKKQQKFFGIVRAAQKGTLKGKKTLEVQRAAASMKEKDVKKFASTKHKGLPERKKVKVNEDAKMAKQSDDKLKAAHKKFSGMDKSPANTFMLKRIQREINRRKKNLNYSMQKEDYVKELEDGLVKMDYPTYDEVDKLMCKIAKDNDIDTTTLHMAFKTKHLMVPDDWAKKKMFEPVMIPKTPKDLSMKEESQSSMLARVRETQTAMSGNTVIKAKKGEAAKQHQLINKDIGIKSKTPVEKPKLKNPEKEFHSEGNLNEDDGNYFMNKIAKEKGLDLTDPRQRRRANSLARHNAAKGNVNNPSGFSKRKKKKRVLMRTEGNLHKWFKGSKSKDGKGGWVNVVTGGTCASDEPGEGTPKCVSSSKRASMTKAERLSAARRKKKADPNQQSKSGAAKPTYVSTDKPKKKKVSEGVTYINPNKNRTEVGTPKGMKPENKKKPQEKPVTKVPYENLAAEYAPKGEGLDERLGGKGVSRKAAAGSIYPGKKGDGDYPDSDRGAGNKAKRRSGGNVEKKSPTFLAFIKNKKNKMNEGKVRRDEYGDIVGGPKISARQKAKNLAKNEKDEKITRSESFSSNPAQQAAIAIAKKNRKQDLKVAQKKKLQKVNSGFEPNEELVEGTPAWQRKAGKSESGGLNAKGVASYRAANPGSKLKTAVTTKPSKLKKGSKSAKRRLSFCRRMRGMKKKLTSAKTARDPDSRINKALRKWNCSFEPEHGEVISEGKVASMIKSLRRKTKVLEKGQKKKRDAGAIAAKIMRQKEHNKYVNFLPVDEEKKKCGEGEYYCNDDKKCKPIPKGYKIGYGGYLKPENENDESNGKKGGSNGNGNGNGGNGNGHGGNGNGGNGGGNGGGE